jgi:hypothetical protein
LKQRSKNSLKSDPIFGGSGGTGSTTMRYIAAIASRLKYGGEPVSNSTTVLPTLHISLVLSALSLEAFECIQGVSGYLENPIISMISGAIQYGVPTTFQGIE